MSDTVDRGCLMTATEVAAYLGYSVGNVYRLSERNVLPSSKPTGGRLYFFRGEVDAWIASRRRPTTAEMIDGADGWLARQKRIG